MLKIRGFLALALPLTLCSCAVDSWRRSEIVFDDSRVDVELEAYLVDRVPEDRGFAHPSSVEPESMQRFLASLRYESAYADEVEDVIDEANVARLSTAICEGLGRATSAHRIRFQVRNEGEALFGILSLDLMTRGVLFIDENNDLNIVFDLIDDTLDEEEPEWADPTRSRLSNADLIFPEGASIRRDEKGKKRKLWVMMPLSSLTTIEAEEKTEKPEKTTDQEPKVDPADDPKIEPEKSIEELTDSERLQRLRYLEELYEQGVLSKEEYEKQRKALLQGG